MKICTSYFANQKAFSKEGFIAISIARYSPKWFFGPKMLNVAPTSFMLSSACNHTEYLRLYAAILSKLDAKQVVEDIRQISQGKDVCLCCFERPEDFCHRHLLADWLTKNGFEVKEWESAKKKAEVQQLTLFD